MNSYELSRAWFNFAFENPEKIKPIHTAIYLFAVEHCNRLAWKEKFGFPSQMVMECLGIKSWKTYSNALKELVDFGFIKMIEKSKNQYSSNIIAIVKNTKANTKALDNALSNHSQKHCSSIVSINKQLNNKTIKLIEDNYKLVNDNIEKWISNELGIIDKKEKSFEERKKSFIEWFNNEKLKYTGVKGRARVLTQSDENNLKRLFKEYDFEDFKKAIPALYKSQWAKENNMQTISHFLRVENFNKYLEYKEPTKKNAYDI